MRFYNRETELETLATLWSQTDQGGRMAVITGRRRIGKTALTFESVKRRPYIYLFVSKKSEPLLCQEYLRQIRDFLPFPIIGEVTSLKEIFHLLFEAGKERSFTVVIDECQEFLTINPSLYSDIQNLWDQYKSTSRILLLFTGSVYSLMNRIFQDAKEPLFGRADRILQLRPFSVPTLAEILRDHGQTDLQILFNYYLATGCSPKYIDILITHALYRWEEIVDFVISAHSPFLEEGKNLLIEEFGKEYAVYFSILELIAEGKTGRSEIESVLQHNVGGYLERLENDYAVIKRYKPINAKPQGKVAKYQIRDHFLRFWFRFVYRHRTAIEAENFQYVKEAIHRNILSYSGWTLESFFRDLFEASKQFNQIGSYWERGHQNEIDLVAVNDQEKRVIIAEVKRNREKISLDQLRAKASRLVADYQGYAIDFRGLSLDCAKEYLP